MTTNYCTVLLTNHGKTIVWAIGIYTLIYLFFFCHLPAVNHILKYQTNETIVHEQVHDDYLIFTEGCKIPKYHPFDPSVAIFYDEVNSPVDGCHEPSFLKVDNDKVYLNTELTDEVYKGKTLKCTYQAIIRDPNNTSRRADYEVGLGAAKRLEFGKPLKDEFVKVKCFIGKKSAFFDYLAMVLLKPSVEERCNLASKENLGSDPLNVIIIAVDSTSKLNYLRHFPMTNGLLQTKLKPFDFHGHNKVADNTFVNIVPMITGHFVSYYRKEEEIKTTYYDDLDFVWKEFAALGYRTFFIEDTPNGGTFSYEKQGFKNQATDYYLRPFAVTVEKSRWRAKRGHYCCGHTSEIEFFYGYFKEFVRRMDKRPFFAFTFISRPTHDYLNHAGFADRPTFDLMQNLMNSNVLNNSVLIFFSDHGIRFGKIRETYIGKIEERMPFMFQHYPEWFLKKHEHIRRALTINQRRLTTPFDVHKTLQDVARFSSKNQSKIFPMKDEGFGQSLFQELSPNRTCNNSQITPHWCSCYNRIKLKNNDSKVLLLAKKMINIINGFTNSTSNTSLCVQLHLQDIIDAYVSTVEATTSHGSRSMDNLYYLVTATAKPSGAVFEGTFQFVKRKIRYLGEISRINSYGNQSWCIHKHVLKKYCFCNKSVEDQLPE